VPVRAAIATNVSRYRRDWVPLRYIQATPRFDLAAGRSGIGYASRATATGAAVRGTGHLDAVALAGMVIPALWAAWALYWWMTSRNVKQFRRMESGWSRIAHFGPLTLAGLLLALPTMPGLLGERLLPLTWEWFWTGTAMVAFGLGLSIRARIVLGTNWSASVTIKHDHEIIRSGPYRWARHPIYTGLLLAFVGSAIARGEWRGVLAVLIALASLWRKLRLEERWLEEEFGDEYADYQRSVSALIPFIL